MVASKKDVAPVALGVALLVTAAWIGGTWMPRPMVGGATILPAMILCTLLAGGYTIIRARSRGLLFWRGWVVKVFTAGLLLAANIAFVAHDLLVSTVFGLYAVWRSGQLFAWAVEACRPLVPRPVHLQRAASWRLALGGGLNLVAVGFCLGASATFFAWWPNPAAVQHEMARLVEYQLAVRRQSLLHENPQAHPSDSQRPPPRPFEPLLDASRPGVFQFKDATFTIGGDLYAAHFELGAGGQGFVLRAWPTRMPVFPYNRIIALPSFYADQTGAIRAIQVSRRDVRCPLDAPIRSQVHGRPPTD